MSSPILCDICPLCRLVAAWDFPKLARVTCQKEECETRRIPANNRPQMALMAGWEGTRFTFGLEVGLVNTSGRNFQL